MVSSILDETLSNSFSKLKDYCKNLSDGYTYKHYDEIAKIIGVTEKDIEDFLSLYSDVYKDTNDTQAHFDVILSAAGGVYKSLQQMSDSAEKDRTKVDALYSKVKTTVDKIVDKYFPEVTKGMQDNGEYGYRCWKAAGNRVGFDDLVAKYPDDDVDTLYDIYRAAWIDKGEAKDRETR